MWGPVGSNHTVVGHSVHSNENAKTKATARRISPCPTSLLIINSFFGHQSSLLFEKNIVLLIS